jgi:uncharacterized protein (UPF0335 family)
LHHLCLLQHTDTLIHNKSWHPNEHRLASISYLIHRLKTYPITHDEKEKDKNIIQMLKANGYDVKILNKNKQVKVKSGVQKQQEKNGPYLHILGTKYIISPTYLPSTKRHIKTKKRVRKRS